MKIKTNFNNLIEFIKFFFQIYKKKIFLENLSMKKKHKNLIAKAMSLVPLLVNMDKMLFTMQDYIKIK